MSHNYVTVFVLFICAALYAFAMLKTPQSISPSYTAIQNIKHVSFEFAEVLQQLNKTGSNYIFYIDRWSPDHLMADQNVLP